MRQRMKEKAVMLQVELKGLTSRPRVQYRSQVNACFIISFMSLVFLRLNILETRSWEVLLPDLDSCRTIRSVKQEAADAEGSGRSWPRRKGGGVSGAGGEAHHLLTSCYFWWAAGQSWRQSWRQCWRLQLTSPTLSAGQLEKKERGKKKSQCTSWVCLSIMGADMTARCEEERREPLPLPLPLSLQRLWWGKNKCSFLNSLFSCLSFPFRLLNCSLGGLTGIYARS